MTLHIALLCCIYLCSIIQVVASVTISAECINSQLGDNYEYSRMRSEERNCSAECKLLPLKGFRSQSSTLFLASAE